MIKFSKDKVLLLHKLIAQETGGSIGLRDEALLDSALENAFAGFDGQEFYPTKTIVSVTEANQNFSRVTRIAEKNGQAVIFKNNKPKYMLVDLDVSPMIDMTDDEKIDVVAARILKKYKPAFMELAK